MPHAAVIDPRRYKMDRQSVHSSIRHIHHRAGYSRYRHKLHPVRTVHNPCTRAVRRHRLYDIELICNIPRDPSHSKVHRQSGAHSHINPLRNEHARPGQQRRKLHIHIRGLRIHTILHCPPPCRSTHAGMERPVSFSVIILYSRIQPVSRLPVQFQQQYHNKHNCGGTKLCRSNGIHCDNRPDQQAPRQDYFPVVHIQGHTPYHRNNDCRRHCDTFSQPLYSTWRQRRREDMALFLSDDVGNDNGRLQHDRPFRLTAGRY